MKLALLVLFMLAGLPVVFAREKKKYFIDRPNTYAVVVGISAYADSKIIQLKYAHRDAESFRNFLVSPGGGSVPASNIVLLTNEKATRAAILGGLRRMFQSATEDDVIVFYFAGHGLPDPKVPKDLFFATYDTDDQNYVGTALLKGQVESEFMSSPAKLKLFLADACHSGGTGIYLGTRDDGADLVNRLVATQNSVKEPSWAALTAASRTERSMEDVKWGGGHGVFTYYLILGLGGEADKIPKKNPRSKGDGNGIVTVREIYDYLNNIIPQETNKTQHPDKQGFNEDIFPVSAVNPDLYASAVVKYIRTAPAPVLPDDKVVAPVKKATLEEATIDMPRGSCDDGNITYGRLNFINDFKEEVLVYFILNHIGGFRMNLLLAGDAKTISERLAVAYVTAPLASRDVKLYFKTVDETKPIRYGAMTINIEACKVKSYVLTKKNLYLSADGEKR